MGKEARHRLSNTDAGARTTWPPRGPAPSDALHYSAGTNLNLGTMTISVSWTASASPSRCCAETMDSLARHHQAPWTGTLSGGTANVPSCAQPCCHRHLCLTTCGSSFCLSQDHWRGGKELDSARFRPPHPHTQSKFQSTVLSGPTNRWLACSYYQSRELSVEPVGQGDAAGVWSTANLSLFSQTTERNGPVSILGHGCPTSAHRSQWKARLRSH